MNYLKIDNCNMNNGSGLRIVVWVSGCDHHCHNCFNPETWDADAGDPITPIIANYILEGLSHDWCSGITFTGGDPLYSFNYLTTIQLCKEIKEKYPDKSIWVYTGGNYDDFDKNDLQYIDVLVDGEYIDCLKTPDKHWAGSNNQRVIDVQASLKNNQIVLYKDD